ncbi:hypothetical protein [Streptomyces sp. NBC_01483]|uniref:hypothetical protein n=1 Tax=Streptomyces sp. NBC_01483 TaxID=2903883 RepID=UPI002E371B92|nr:hypothetical protein [Streptomyces sp. NBC_01483]
MPNGQADTTAVPAELITLVQDFVRWRRHHVDDAVRTAHLHIEQPTEWHRPVLYALTDALAYDFLLVGTLAGYLQEQGTDADLLRGHLQSPDPDRYVNQEALDLPAGLMGRPLAEGARESTWHFVGRQIAEYGVQGAQSERVRRIVEDAGLSYESLSEDVAAAIGTRRPGSS